MSTTEPPRPPGPQNFLVPGNPREITHLPASDPLDNIGAAGTPADSGKALAALIRGHPFIAFYCRLAELQYPAVTQTQSRVAMLRQSNKKSALLYWLAVAADYLAMLVAIVFVIAVAVLIAYKAIMPIPPLSNP